MSTKDKPSKAEKAKNSKKPPQEPAPILESREPAKEEPPTLVDEMKANGIDFYAISTQAGAITSYAITSLWENCTKENLDKLTELASNANEQLKANGIDVYGLTDQAATSLG